MSHATTPVVRDRTRVSQDGGVPALEPGDHLDQKMFHERYEAAPEHVKAELIGGVVWLDPQALIELDAKRLVAALQQGLATLEHAEFAQQLACD